MNETPEQRQKRVAGLVADRWPDPLSYNRCLNTILDIVRGKYDSVFPEEYDRKEAIDALAERNLPHTLRSYPTNWGPIPIGRPVIKLIK